LHGIIPVIALEQSILKWRDPREFSELTLANARR
jgi:hypothetical protein